jgi:hypothetical protein
MFYEHVSHVFKHNKTNTCTSMGHTHDLITSTHNIHMLQMLQGHVSSKDAHEMMMLMVMPCYNHAQMMLKCKANIWGVTALPLVKNIVPRFGKRTIFFYKRQGKLLANNLPAPTLHLSHYGYSTWSYIISPLDFRRYKCMNMSTFYCQFRTEYFLGFEKQQLIQSCELYLTRLEAKLALDH